MVTDNNPESKKDNKNNILNVNFNQSGDKAQPLVKEGFVTKVTDESWSFHFGKCKFFNLFDVSFIFFDKTDIKTTLSPVEKV